MPLSAKKLVKKAWPLFLQKSPASLQCKLDTPEPREVCPCAFNTFLGWAFDTNGRHITGIEIYQSGLLLGSCDYGLERKDVYRAYPGHPQAEKSDY